MEDTQVDPQSGYSTLQIKAKIREIEEQIKTAVTAPQYSAQLGTLR